MNYQMVMVIVKVIVIDVFIPIDIVDDELSDAQKAKDNGCTKKKTT